MLMMTTVVGRWLVEANRNMDEGMFALEDAVFSPPCVQKRFKQKVKFLYGEEK